MNPFPELSRDDLKNLLRLMAQLPAASERSPHRPALTKIFIHDYSLIFRWRQSRSIRFDKTFWSKIEDQVAVWLGDVCDDRRLNKLLVPRAEDAILHRLRI